MKRNPPNKDFKILRPQKMEPLDLKASPQAACLLLVLSRSVSERLRVIGSQNPMATRAHDHQKERRKRLDADERTRSISAMETRMDDDEGRAHRAFSHETTVILLARSAVACDVHPRYPGA